MHFNALLGLGAMPIDSNLIEGAETRRLEGRNASMTTATETMEMSMYESCSLTLRHILSILSSRFLVMCPSMFIKRR